MTTPGGYTTAQRSYAVTVSGIAGQFSTMTGGKKSRTTSQAWNGGAKTPDTVPGPAQVEAITVSRPFNPRRDQPILEKLRRDIDNADKRFTIRKQSLDGNDTAVGKPETYSGCVLTGVSGSDYDRSSSTPATLTLEFAPQSVS